MNTTSMLIGWLEQTAPVAVLALLFASSFAMGPARAETLRFDTQIVEVEPVAADVLVDGLDAWAVSGATQAIAEGGRLTVPAGEPAMAWYREPVEGAFLITLTATVAGHAEGGEVGIAFCAARPDGGDLLADPPTDFGDLNCYAMTLGRTGMRLYENPGGRMVDRNTRLGASTEYSIAILKSGERIRVFVDDRLALDWNDYPAPGSDETPLGGGLIGLRAAGAQLTIGDLAFWQVTSSSVAMIEQLKDLSLETDLRDALIVVGASDTHREMGAQIAEGIRQRTGAAVEVVAERDPDEMLSSNRPLIVLGNFADNATIERLYYHWYTVVDRAFPGPGGYCLQTIHDPYGSGQNVVVIGASDDEGLARATREFVASIPGDGVIGRLYEVAASEAHMRLAEWDYGERLIIPAGWPQHFALGNYGSRDDPRHSGMVYLLTGDDSWAERYREQMLRWIDKGLQGHLYVPGWMEIWDLVEEHPVFSDEERLAITNWFLTQVRSRECFGALHIQRWAWGMPHQNHGTRPGIGTFFMGRYFRHGYAMPEMDVYLSRISDYFAMQDDWSKPMCDSSMHQWEATLEDKAIYALASGELGFFESGAARGAAERALQTVYNNGMLPTIGDAQYGSSPLTLLAKCAHYYRDGRYLWPGEQRADEPMASSDEVLRTFAGDVQPEQPDDTVGVCVVPYDRGFWQGWRDLPEVSFFNPPNIEYEQAFDKIAFRTGLAAKDEFLLLDGMVGASHDYDDTNTIHLYSRNNREYLVSYDGLFSSTIAWHNGVNVVRDGVSSDIPYFAERLHADDLGPVMLSQTRLNDFADSDWTRSVLLVPGRYFVVIDGLRAREAGTFTFTGHWKTLGEPSMASDTLTVAQWPRADGRSAENETYFHMQTPGQRVAHKRLEYLRYGRGARYYPYADPAPNMVTQSISSQLSAGQSDFLYSLAHETGNVAEPQYRMHPLGAGVVRIIGADYGACVGAPTEPFTLDTLKIDADAFHLTADTLSVAGGRRAEIGATIVLSADAPVTVTVRLSDGVVVGGEGACVTAALPEAARAALVAQLASAQFDVPEGQETMTGGGEALKAAWEYDAGGKVAYLRAFAGNPGAEVRPPDRLALPADLGVVAVPSAAGHVAFVAPDGAEVGRIEAGVPVHDVCVADIDGDGAYETMIARADSTLECRSADGTVRWTYKPEAERAVNSSLYIPSNPALYTFVVDRGDGLTVCVATGDQRLHGLSPDGERQWLFWSYAGLFGIHGLYDVDGDGVREIAGGNPEVSSTDALYFLNGADVWMRRVLSDGWGSTLSSMAIGDVNGDGRDEIAFGTGRASLHVIAPTMDDDGRLFQRKLGDDVRGTEIINGGDGKPLIVTGSTSEFVTAFDGSGARHWATAVGGPVWRMTSAIVDGQWLVVAALEGGEILVLSAEGEIVARGAIEGRPTALTVTATPEPLIVVAADTGVLTAFEVPRGVQ